MFGSKRALIRLQIVAERRKTKDLRLARGGEEVTGGRRKGCLEGQRRQKTSKNALSGLRWHKHRWRVARRRQVRLEVEARGRKVLHTPSRTREESALPGAWTSPEKGRRWWGFSNGDTVDRKTLGDGKANVFTSKLVQLEHAHPVMARLTGYW
ncbi:hypothetical protein CK203_071916 [Vitis vinifera]|uniref:Uncharacterized protein n=1 Tax=Vitis vinifera TaxID=29760 RepID=A0A438F4B6_VITVI|nr:hypothetical protein CK203_071916 [Vitis vinifera]